MENNDRSDNALTMACLGGNSTIVKHLVDIGANVHYRNANKETVLMKACERGDKDSMDYLLSHFTSAVEILVILTSQNKHGNTCLMRACTTGNLKVRPLSPYAIPHTHASPPIRSLTHTPLL